MNPLEVFGLIVLLLLIIIGVATLLAALCRGAEPEQEKESVPSKIAKEARIELLLQLVSELKREVPEVKRLVKDQKQEIGL
jgi:hypothetical protein